MAGRGVFDRLIGQASVEAELRAAVAAARSGSVGSAMTHAWLFTGPPGSGRSVVATCFAAALQCTDQDTIGCGECHACRTVLSGTHGDVRSIVPEGLSISVKEMRKVVSTAIRRPTTGDWQIVIIEDADRLTDEAGNALLKVVEEPPAHTVILLCAPSDDPEDILITLRSRCRHVHVASPTVTEIAGVLSERDGIDRENALWAAAASGGHVGRARRLASDSAARDRREAALYLAKVAARPGLLYSRAQELVVNAQTETKLRSAEVDEREVDEWRTAYGAGGTGRGAAGAIRGAAGALKELESRQKARATRAARDVYDYLLTDLAGLYRDALARSFGSVEAHVGAIHPDQADVASSLARGLSAPQILRCIEAILACRTAIDESVKPDYAFAAMAAALNQNGAAVF